MTYRYMVSSHFLIPKHYENKLLINIAMRGVPRKLSLLPQTVTFVKFYVETIATIKNLSYLKKLSHVHNTNTPTAVE